MKSELLASRGQIILVDEDMLDELSEIKWHVIKGGYACNKNKKMVYIHRYIMGAKKGEVVDHINGDKLDNRKSNLRICNQSLNLANSKIRADNKTGYKGVHRTKRSDSYEATIYYKGKSKYIGRFKELLDAVKAYDETAVKLFGDYAKINITQEKNNV